jgi:hypothetical protein
VPVEKLLEAGKLQYFGPGKEQSIVINSFVMTIVEFGGSIKSYPNEENNLLTGEMKDAIANVVPGTKIFFEYITCVDESGSVMKLAAFQILIE